MANLNPTEILESLHKKSTTEKIIPVSIDIKNKLEFICRCHSNKAPIRFLMSCLLAKIHNSNIDIRKPYTEIKGKNTYSGRHYDEKYIAPFILKYKLPCNLTTAYLTPAFRNINQTLTPKISMVGRPKKVYEYTLNILDVIFKELESPEKILQSIIYFLLLVQKEDEQRMTQLLKNLKQEADVLPLSTEEIITLLIQHLNCKGSSRLPVLMVAAAYQTVQKQIGETHKVLQAHNAADKQTGTIGDIEITFLHHKNVITAYEMKDKRIKQEDIEIALQKLSAFPNEIDNYIFITTESIETDVLKYAKQLYEQIGIEFVILDCIGFVRYFLHFFHRQRNIFLNYYQQLVLAESTSAISQPLKEAFLILRKAAETDR